MTAAQFRATEEGKKLSATSIASYVAPELARGHDGTYFEYRDGIWVRDPEAVRRRVADALGDDYSVTVLGQVEAHLLNIFLPTVGVRTIAGGLAHIVLERGVYYWDRDEYRPHDPDLLALSRLPIDYDADARCPRFEAWLLEVLSGNRDLLAHTWEVIGYCLMTGNPFQKAVLLYGEGRNGKGTFLRVLSRLLGEDNYSALSLHTLVEDRFSAAELFGKIANISGDLSDRFVKQPEIVKQITGGDAITAAHKYGQPFTFVPYAVPVFAANTFFRSSDTSHGWRRRWLVIDFLERFEEGSFDESELLAESAGIFNESMRALRRLMERGRFTPPARALDAAQQLHEDGDPFVMWLDEDNAVNLGDGESSPKTDVYGRYAKWSRLNGYQPMASGPFGKRLAERGITSERPRVLGHRVMTYRGISVVHFED